MRKILVLVVLSLVFFVIGCDRIEPVDNPQPELFSVLHEGDNFTFMIRTNIDPNALYYSYAVYIQSPDGQNCVIGDYEMRNYLVHYEDEYYDILSGSKLHLYTTDDLIEWGVYVGCPENT